MKPDLIPTTEQAFEAGRIEGLKEAFQEVLLGGQATGLPLFLRGYIESRLVLLESKPKGAPVGSRETKP